MADQPSIEEAKARIVQLRSRLSSISRVSFVARSGPRSRCGWTGVGEGRVTVDVARDGSVRFLENGQFRLDSEGASPVAFHNVFRWQPDSGCIALSHERRGTRVWLFDLVAASKSDFADLISREAHLCIADRYRARLRFADAGFDLEWIITGPKKDERLQYRYR